MKQYDMNKKYGGKPQKDTIRNQTKEGLGGHQNSEIEISNIQCR